MRLAAECRILATDADGADDTPITIPSLLTMSLHRKRPKAEFAGSPRGRRSVSTRLSPDGSVCATQHYLVTDSIEPPPYHVARVQTPSKLRVHPPLTEGIMDVEPLKRELQIQNSQKKVISWDRAERVVSHQLVDVDRDQEPHRVSDQIIQDIMEPLKVDEQVHATQRISATGHAWTDRGMPPSLSGMLES
jgi:hypothetical protein